VRATNLISGYLRFEAPSVEGVDSYDSGDWVAAVDADRFFEILGCIERSEK